MSIKASAGARACPLFLACGGHDRHASLALRVEQERCPAAGRAARMGASLAEPQKGPGARLQPPARARAFSAPVKCFGWGGPGGGGDGNSVLVSVVCGNCNRERPSEPCLPANAGRWPGTDSSQPTRHTPRRATASIRFASTSGDRRR